MAAPENERLETVANTLGEIVLGDAGPINDTKRA